MPAAAVIPAPIAYIKVAAVKKLVVGSRVRVGGPPLRGFATARFFSRSYMPVHSSPRRCSWLSARGGRDVYFEKIRVFKAGPLRA